VGEQPGYRRRERDVRGAERGRETGIRRQARVRVDLEDRKPAVRADTKIDPRIARQTERVPAVDRKGGRPRRKLGLDAEAARRRAIFEALRIPLRGVADDPGLARRKRVELD